MALQTARRVDTMTKLASVYACHVLLGTYVTWSDACPLGKYLDIDGAAEVSLCQD